MENVVIAGMMGPWQIGLIVLAILLLFGGRKIPELMRGMGKGIKGFKDEMKGDGEAESKSSSTEVKAETKSED